MSVSLTRHYLQRLCNPVQIPQVPAANCSNNTFCELLSEYSQSTQLPAPRCLVVATTISYRRSWPEHIRELAIGHDWHYIIETNTLTVYTKSKN